VMGGGDVSAIGWDKGFWSGKSGASERAPQMRGKNLGSMRNGAGLVSRNGWPRVGSGVVRGNTSRLFPLGRRLGSCEEFVQPSQAFLDAIDRSCIRNTQRTRGAKSV